MERLTKYEPCEGGIPLVTVEDEQSALQRLAAYEDAEEQGLLVRLPCGEGAKLMYDGKEYTADHWNIFCTGTMDDEAVPAGYRVHLFGVEEAEAALAKED